MKAAASKLAAVEALPVGEAVRDRAAADALAQTALFELVVPTGEP